MSQIFSAIHTQSKPHEMVCFATKFQTPEVIVSDTPDPAAHAADQTDGWLITNRNSACSIWLKYTPCQGQIKKKGFYFPVSRWLYHYISLPSSLSISDKGVFPLIGYIPVVIY